ncbi:MAG: flagellar type III secretion system pore protein FliP [Gemmatimonadaceae bacterium]
MLIAGLGVLAALAFVLGLGAICLWALKRFGRVSLSPKTRVAVEVVQRTSLGPKAGLAIVRVGEKVMAVSVSDGGVRPLFELDEADRLRVLASSQVPTPQVSSPRAMASLAQFVPGAFGKALREAATTATPVAAAPVATPVGVTGGWVPAQAAALPSPAFYTAAPVMSPVMSPVAPAVPASPTALPMASPMASSKVPSAPTVAAVFGGSLRGAMRLAVFAAAMVLSATAARPAFAQVATPPAPPIPPAAPAAAQAAARAAAPAVAAPRPATAVPAPTGTALPPAPVAARPNGLPASAPISAPARQAADSAAAAANGASPNVAQPASVSTDEAMMRLLPQMDVKLGNEKDGGLRLNGTVGVVVIMGMLSLLPTLLLMMTGFTRILIVLHFLKQAMGTQSAPPAQLIGALALLLTGFVMAPTLAQVNEQALTPWLDGKISQVEMMKTGVKPIRAFMLKQTRSSDLQTFVELSRLKRPKSVDDVPIHVVMSAFVASELRTAFQIGFAIYLPFIIIDTVVASVLMSMGMMMLPPAMISLPFKLLLFVLVDGWSLTISSLIQSFK